MTRLEDYRTWHHIQVETGDIDPVYPVYRHLGTTWHLSADELAWLCVCHVVYYHMGSGLRMFESYPHPADLPATFAGLEEAGLLTLPTATERRAHRDQRQLAKHLLGLREDMGEAGALAWTLQTGGTSYGWEDLNRRLMELHGNGRWAAYKLAEMFQKIVGVPTVATDAGHRNSSGPRHGLHDLYGDDLPRGNSPGELAELDALTAGLATWIGEPDLAHVETTLCDFHSMLKGGYYTGHDIDGMQAQLAGIGDDSPVWAARSASFDPRLLGEVGGWVGYRRELKTAYRDRGILDIRELA